MKRIIIRYRVKPDRVEENQRLIKQVFEEINRTNPSGMRYASFKQADGVSFVHITSIETDDEVSPLQQSPAFQAFQAGLKDRCDELPVAVELTEIGSYRLF